MGGGRRGKRMSYAATRDSEARAAYTRDRGKTLSDYPHSLRTKTFISFYMGDEQQVNLLRYQAANSDKLEFRDTSLKEPFDEKWKTQCTEVIKSSDIVVVAIGKDTHTRPAVIWEIEKAHELGKPVIGMRIYSDQNHTVPEPMAKNGDSIVEWKLEALQAEIDKQKALKEEAEQRREEKKDNLAYA